MFEAHVLHLLRRYLGEYVQGLSAEALRISVWKGDVVLKDLKLKAEALNALQLPVTVKAGFVGSVTLKVPWKSLGKEPVIVLVDRVFILAKSASDYHTLKEEDREKLFEAKLQQIEELESATIEAILKSKSGTPQPGSSWLGSLIATIIGNLKISISNVHIRYEDSESNSGYPFSTGITLAKLAAVTMDDQGNETFDTSGALDKLRKSLQLERLAVYHDCNSLPWTIDKRWEDLSPKEWVEIFEDGINEPVGSHTVSKWATNRNYLVSPINGSLKYHRLGKQERNDPDVPFEKAAIAVRDVSLTITEGQYHDWIKLFEVFSRYRVYVDVSHLRPAFPVLDNPRSWWRYASQASVQQRKMCYRFSWDQIKHFSQLRRHYVQLYAGFLQQSSEVKVSDLREIERDLDPKVILLWRLLAHAKVESVKSKEAAEQRKLQQRSWFSFRWRTPSEENLSVDVSEEQLDGGKLTMEEWQAVNNLLSYQQDEDSVSHSTKDTQNVIRILLSVSIGQVGVRIVNRNKIDVVCARCEQLNVSTKLKLRSTQYDVSLKYYGLSAPEGSLAESVSSEQKMNALAASFVSSPADEDVDWKLSATISPCYVTVLVGSYNRFMEFVKRSNAVSPTITLETTAALQMKIEKVTRRAQEQFQMVLEEQSRFALDIDLDAPKVRIPVRTHGSATCDSHLVFDFGNFTLCTKDSQLEGQRQRIYSRFYIAGRDIAAFFTECGSGSHDCDLVSPTSGKKSTNPHLLEETDKFCSLIERCGVAVIVDQIKVPHPSFPSTHISIQVPNLGIHFSPSRYHQLMDLLNICDGVENAEKPAADGIETVVSPWIPADLANDARILVWKGIANSMAKWQPCFLVLSGFHLYALESAKSQTYQRCLSMAGRQVHEVPPANVGGSKFCLAVISRGMDIQKALEASSTWILEFQDEVERLTWSKGLIQATYQASAPPQVNVLEEMNKIIGEVGGSEVAANYRPVDLVVNGSLVETKLLVYGKVCESDDASSEEMLILEVLATGGKVHVMSCEGDLTVKTKLHSLQIKDKLQGRLSASSQYLAYSVGKSGSVPSSPDANESSYMYTPRAEEDDIFKDALSDFMSVHESSLFSTQLDSPVSKVGEFSSTPRFDHTHALMHEVDVGRGKGFYADIFFEAQDSDHLDFVSVNFATRGSGSPDYDGIDTQMSISMSKLEFFCNRPTLVALIGFGMDLSSASTMREDEPHRTPVNEDLLTKEKDADWGVTGLLGYGRGRVIFNLSMNVDSVCLFLNKEDGSQLAMLVQESFLLDIKVYPSSLSIESTLGNFKLRDLSLEADNCWSWLCDIRNPGVDSLIKFKFDSYSAEDDDYEGYDYCLSGKLSAVRIVFLYRFVQEVTAYFMGLANPQTEEAIKLVDRVGDFEWLIQKYEIDGSSAIKLDLSLDTPIIIVPRNSISKEFIQLDLGQLQVTNEVSWHGSPDTDPSAVRVDVLHSKILGINMSIGIDGCIGKPMIRKGRGFDIFVRRSLRDVFRKVPNFSLEVKIGLLHAVMSDREYNVIRDCLIMNLFEEPSLPPNFRGCAPASKDTMRLLADKVNMNSQIILSRTVTIVAVEVHSALLELCTGDEGSPLAHIALESMWVLYRMTSLSEADLYVTVPKFSILDARPETKSEMRMMLGSSYDSSKQMSLGDLPYLSNRESLRRIHSVSSAELEVPNPTMFLMDYRYRTSSQSFVIRIQQPKILVVPDFLLAVGEFFVPSLGAITGREETMDPRNDPMTKGENIVLSEAVYKQEEEIIYLSPDRQLVADSLGVEEYIYDGCGGIICLSEDVGSRENYSRRREPIIILGRGKKLQFVNVKIKNGTLLRKRTYLSNESSYSVASEDGVEILDLEKSPVDDEKKNHDFRSKSLNNSDADLTAQNDPQSTQSFTFEGQVLSPEFTFYDSTKSFLKDSTQGEKLLRARMDFSFMYAAKENDTWVRALVKDLMVEAGSGLIILDPVDISAGYTSVREKISISLLSSDICIHLSLSALSLVMNLLNQASVAMQFGNTNPLAPCTNFDRLWVSPKENGPGNNITFWRPQAPSNYVVLGDCITSRPIPPSHAVMAVSNIYGRARKPTGFTLIGKFCGSQDGETNEEHSLTSTDNACYIWMPIAPPGFKALGCVVHSGGQPPPNHVVYCIRSDLVTSSMYSECMFVAAPNQEYPSGFSIWRSDNVVGSFYAHISNQCPPKDYCLDLGHIIMWSSIQHQTSKETTPDQMQDCHDGGQQTTDQSVSSSGWDVVRSISKATHYYMSTPHFERIWLDKGNDVRRPVSVWRPIARSGYAVLGDCVTEGLEPPSLGIVFKVDNPDIAARPVQFTKVAQISGKGVDEIFFWFPIAPPGYVSLGCVVSRSDVAPSSDLFCCPRMDLVNQANIYDMPISRSSSSRGSQCWSIWRVENQACTFLARSDIKRPSGRLAYTLCDSVKPKTRDNVAADMRLRRFSLTVLDSLCGTMTPLFDTTITNIKLATHGRLDAMNAVLISSMAASAFNTQLEAWEPLIEPFEGIFKFETFTSGDQSPSVVGKRLRVAATSVLNINITAANVATFAETAISWRRIVELEQRAAKLSQEASRKGEDPDFSALDEDDYQTVIVENKLGCDLFLKRLEENIEIVDLLHNDDQALVWIPPPRFSDRLNVADEFREAHQYVAVQILEAKDLPILDDGNSHSFFCALRLVIDNQATEQQRLFPQSARTRCVKPSLSKDKGVAKWGELFIFEVPRKDAAVLEVEVTNLAAKAGKGEVVGAFSLPVGHGAHRLKKVVSGRIYNQPHDVHNMAVCSLKRKVYLNNTEQIQESGLLSVSTYYFERKTGGKLTEDVEHEDDMDRDVGFWVGVNSEGVWESIRSILPVSVVPKSMREDLVAMEVAMKNGKKHVVFRGLVTIVNDSDVKMEIAVGPISSVSMSSISPSSGSNLVNEEVFQNQRYHSMYGWGNKHLGARSNDPDHWSTRDFSYTSKDFFEPSLPSGWKWQSGWSIDKSLSVDSDGWAYGSDFQTLRWPPNSKSATKSSSDTVRRRRWVRTRQQIVDHSMHGVKSEFTAISPGSSVVLPWKSTLKNSDDCFLVRPFVEPPQAPYSWGRAVPPSGYIVPRDQGFDQSSSKQSMSKLGDTNHIFKVNELEKKDILVNCHSAGSEQFWLSVGTDANVLQTELNAPVYDWKISVNSPLELENRLPCSAEFTLWEKTKDGNFIEKHRGVIYSRKAVHIYLVDIRRPVYISLYIQDGWVAEKDRVLFLDMSSGDRISSFWIVHQQSRRRLRVSLEHDLGGNFSAPKAIRIFVPYWIVNDTCVPLAYRMVELEYLENAEPESHSLSKSVRKTVLRNPTNSIVRRPRRNLQVLEMIEDSSPVPSMLSPQDYFGGNALMFSSQKDAYISPRIGIGVAVRNSETYSAGIALHELENKERVDVKAHSSDGLYYMISAYVKMTSDRTKVIHFQPQIMFINRVGCSLCLQQCDSQLVEWIHPSDPPKMIAWQSSSKVELLKLRIDGYKWSSAFSVSSEGEMCVHLQRDNGSEKIQLKVEVRSGTKSSRYEVLFRPNSFFSPYRIENRSMFLPIHFRQAHATSDSWQFLLPNAAASFLWEDLSKRRMLEILFGGTDTHKSESYDIDEISDYQPVSMHDGPVKALRVTVLKEEKVNVIRVTDWMPESETTIVSREKFPSPLPQLSRNDLQQQTPSTSEGEFHIIVDFAELGISVVDHTPEEILYLSVQNIMIAYSTGLGSGISRFKLRLHSLQVDNQLPLSPLPVLFRPQRLGAETDYVLKISVTIQSNGSHDLCVYPYIGVQFQAHENSAFLINIHEPIIWRIHEMIQQANLSRLSTSAETSAVPVDPIIQIGVLDLSEVRFKVSMAMSPSQRPRGVLGFWSSLMTALGNTENMPVKINQRYHQNVSMRQSSMISNAVVSIRKDLLSQPFQLLSGVDILGNASSALGHMSKGVAALSMDKKFIQSRQRQENKGVEDIGDVIREGGGALAKGLFRGVTGILTKPLEGAKSSGVEGFVQGVGKGIIGAAAQPVSGVLDLLSKTTEGANAMRMKILSAITSEDQLLRRRLSRVIGGDNLLRPYNEYKAEGQVILQLAECGSFLGQVDLFKVRGKFALSDAFEDHFLLPKGKIVVVTHRRVILLQQPANIIGQKKFNPTRDPCSVLWEVLWDDLMTMELTHGKKDGHKSPRSRLILYLKTRPQDREQTRIIKCTRETLQAEEVYSSIQRALNTYGPHKSKIMLKNKVSKPYSPMVEAEPSSKETTSVWSAQQQLPLSSPFGTGALL